MGDHPIAPGQPVKPPPPVQPGEVLYERFPFPSVVGGCWHRWFAWRPVWTPDRGYQWMRMVWRCYTPPKYGVPGSCWTWNYRALRPAEGSE